MKYWVPLVNSVGVEFRYLHSSRLPHCCEPNLPASETYISFLMWSHSLHWLPSDLIARWLHWNLSIIEGTDFILYFIPIMAFYTTLFPMKEITSEQMICSSGPMLTGLSSPPSIPKKLVGLNGRIVFCFVLKIQLQYQLGSNTFQGWGKDLQENISIQYMILFLP